MSYTNLSAMIVNGHMNRLITLTYGVNVLVKRVGQTARVTHLTPSSSFYATFLDNNAL